MADKDISVLTEIITSLTEDLNMVASVTTKANKIAITLTPKKIEQDNDEK